jgi:hypothetical protein
VTNGQLVDIVVQELRDRPADRHLSAAIPIWNALFRAFGCEK